MYNEQSAIREDETKSFVHNAQLVIVLANVLYFL